MHVCIHAFITMNYEVLTSFFFIGIAFWKTGSRKIFAVKKPSKKRKTRSSHENFDTISSSDSSEYDGGNQDKRKHKKSNTDHELASINNKLAGIESVLSENKAELLKVLTFSKDYKVPVALKNMVKDSFSCKICHKAPMDTPILASRCCGTIIGCETCVQTWYGTGSNVFDKCCPHCRSERGYSHTFRLTGIDEFLNQLRNILREQEES